MYKPHLILILMGLIAFSACATAPTATSSVLTAENAWGDTAPPEARTISPEDFEAGIRDGSLVLEGPAASKLNQQKALAAFQSDLAALRAIPEAERNANVRDLLAQAAGDANPFEEPRSQLGAASGGETVVTLSLATMVSAALEAERQAVDPVNALAAYRLTFEGTPEAQRQGLPSPAELQGQSLAAIRGAMARLEAVLDGVVNLERVRVERGTELQTQSFTPIAGGGSDGPFLGCPKTANGIHKNFWWPLKRFSSFDKNQGARGTCWAFAALAAVESRDMVIFDVRRNLSEQFFVHNWKMFTKDGGTDGGSAETALSFTLSFPDATSIIPSEDFWTYNRSPSRVNSFNTPPFNYTQSCNGYSGSCSNFTHQAPTVCAYSALLKKVVCASERAKYFDDGKSGASSSKTVQVWKQGEDLSVGAMKAQLSSGHALLASFKTYRGFEQTDANGFVTDYTKLNTNGEDKAGGHAVLIVGYIGNTALKAQLPDAPSAEGGGYFIVKNSWGCTADGGYHYVPVAWIKQFFNRISSLDFQADRSERWKTEQQGKGKAGPQIAITGEPDLIRYADLTLPNFIQAKVSDAQDGATCCSSTLTWTSKNLGALGSGAEITPTLGAGGKPPASDVVTVSARDSDGNTSSINLTVIDTYPVVQIPQNFPGGPPIFPQKPATFNADVKRFGTENFYPCTGVTWATNVAGDPTAIGCEVKLSFPTSGLRTLTATYQSAGRPAATATMLLSVTAADPSVTITAPFNSLTDTGEDNYVDFSKPIPLSATASDPQDGTNCCTVTWTSIKRPNLGSGKTIAVNFSSLLTNRIFATATDSDGNTKQTSIFLRDATPIIKFFSPIDGQKLVLNTTYPFIVSVQAFGLGNNYDCSSVQWKTNVSSDGTRVGCSVQYSFASAGPRTVSATYNSTGRVAEVGTRAVTVGANTAPLAVITTPSVRIGGVPTYQAGEAIILGALVGDNESFVVNYQWTLVSNPNARGETRSPITGVGLIASGALTAAGQPAGELSTSSFKLEDFGAICEVAERPYAIELTVWDGAIGNSETKSVTVTRAIQKGSCKP